MIKTLSASRDRGCAPVRRSGAPLLNRAPMVMHGRGRRYGFDEGARRQTGIATGGSVVLSNRCADSEPGADGLLPVFKGGHPEL